MRVTIFYGVLFVVLLVAAFKLLSYANEIDDQCQQKGGTLVRTSEGLKCFDLSNKSLD